MMMNQKKSEFDDLLGQVREVENEWLDKKLNGHLCYGKGSKAPATTTSNVTQTNLPEYLKPYMINLANRAEQESKRKYRRRKSYLLWSDILSKGNFTNQKDAKDILMKVHESNKGGLNSMTHERYAMETMQLALDDYFGTNKLKITPSRFLKRNLKSSNKKKGLKCKQKKKSIQKNVILKNLNYSDLPF